MSAAHGVLWHLFLIQNICARSSWLSWRGSISVTSWQLGSAKGAQLGHLGQRPFGAAAADLVPAHDRPRWLPDGASLNLQVAAARALLQDMAEPRPRALALVYAHRRRPSPRVLRSASRSCPPASGWIHQRRYSPWLLAAGSCVNRQASPSARAPTAHLRSVKRRWTALGARTCARWQGTRARWSRPMQVAVTLG